MIALFGCAALLLLSMLVASFRPVYAAISVKEAARRVKRGDKKSTSIHEVAKYGTSADAVLVTISSILAAVAFVVISIRAHELIAILILIVSIYVIFFVVSTRSFSFSKKLAPSFAPYFVIILSKLKPVLKKRTRPKGSAEIYEKDDLLQLLQAQKSVPANRIEEEELDLARHALTFTAKKVTDHMIPRAKLHMVDSEEPIGPILLTELHDSGYKCFPVHNQQEDTIVGTLFLKDLVEKRATGIVSNVMSPAVFYINQNAPLSQVLAAFTKTKHHIFIVVNDAVEVVGAITIEDVLEQITGHKIEDEFDSYEDMHKVAELIKTERPKK